MKLGIFFSICFLFLACYVSAQEKKWSPADYKDIPFKDFASSSQSLLKIKFFYKDEWVKDLKLKAYPVNFSLSDLLDDLFRGTTIYYFIDRRGNVVLTKDFAVKFPAASEDTGKTYLPPSDYSAGKEEHQKAENTFFDIGNPAEKNNTGRVNISGYIKNGDTKEPVIGATILVQKLSTGTFSNGFGFYTLDLPRGAYILHFSCLGMKEKMINVNLYGKGELNVEMNTVLIPIKEAVISATKNMILNRFEVGMEKINIQSFKLLPTSLGESDIVKSVLLIPGVKSVGEGSAGFNVRGGTADQNLILLYGAPVYNSSHFFGFFSAVNPGIIKDATLYKGGIPSRYGGRISSVLDIGTNEGRNEFKGSAGISPLTTQIMVEGPLIKDTLNYIITGRTTYSNWILGLLNNKTLNESKALFYDLNGKITYSFNKSNKIEFASYISHDAFRFGSDTVFKYYNNILALSWHHKFNSTFLSTFSLNNSFYEYNISSQRHKPESFVLSHKINSTGFKADFNLFKGRNELNFGLELNRYSILPGSYEPASDSSLVKQYFIEKERAIDGALYAEDKFILTDYLSVNAGIRLSSYFTLGPGTIMVYRPGFSKTTSTIIDTLDFNTWEVIKKYAGPEFRLSMNFRISDQNSFKINYNRTRQYLHLLSNSTSISPTDTWKLSDYNLKPQIGDQIAIGFYQLLFNNTIETSAEIYYKKIKNMADFKGGANLVMNEFIEQDIVNVKGKSYGLELLVKKTEGKLRFTLGYTFARTFIRNLNPLKEEIINEGKWFPANFDKPNDLTFTFNYLLSRRFSFSANYTWSTGRPITFPVATYIMYDDLLVHYSDRNKYRIPDYSRLDLSFRIGGSLRLRQIAYPNWTFSVYNLLGRKNVYSIYFKKEGEVINGYKLSVFGQAIPSVTFSFDF
jgi:hypothetical protein